MTITDAASSHGEIDYMLEMQRTSPGTLGGRFMRLFWHPVHRIIDVRNGQAKAIRIMSEDFTLYRGDTGAVHLSAFRCAHRATQLSTGWVEGDNIRCYYHGWAYGPGGQCVDQPGEPEPFCEKVSIHTYPVQEYLGLIFAYLGEGQPPEFPRYPEYEQLEAEAKIHNYYADSPLMGAGSPGNVRHSNVFTNIDNIFDHAHVPFTHGLRSSYRAGIGEPFETDWGVSDRITERDGRVRYTHFGMPNVWESRTNLGGGRQNLAWMVPIDDESFLNLGTSALRPPATNRNPTGPMVNSEAGRQLTEESTRAVIEGRKTIDEVTAPANSADSKAVDINIQDNVAQLGQMGGGLNFHTWRLGQEDAALIRVRRVYERELKAFAEGRPLKQWHHPETQEWGTPLEQPIALTR